MDSAAGVQQDDEEEKEKKGFKYGGMKMPTVVQFLKNILSQYPDNGQIIKELVQNAEDAGASRVDVVHHTHSLDHLNADHSVQRFLRSPALCIYNDAVFSEDDWSGIHKLGDSIKKNDPLRVEQFGLGFKSIFHLTDYVTILSGCKVLLMDPNEDKDRMCGTLSLSDLGEMFPELLQLWGKYLTSQHLVEGTFPGTVFWFPLRQKPSELSPTVYSSKRVKELFDSFSVEAPICLTFLKSLEQVSLQRVATKNPKKAVVVHQVEIGGPDLSDVRKERQRLQQNLQQSKECPSTSITCHYQVTIHTTKGDKSNEQTMLVLHHLPGQQDKYYIKYKGIDAHRYIPLVGVAVPTQPMSTPWALGCLFTFFPLPLDPANTTGLPVQVNAYFTLNQNRRHVKWKTDDSSKEPDVIWNESLVSEVVLEAYHKLLLQVRSQVIQGTYQHQLWYSLLPHLATTTTRWKQLTTQLWRRIITLPILYSPQEQEFKTAENVITDIGLEDCSDEVKTCIRMVLKSHPKPLVKLPDHVTFSLNELDCAPPTVVKCEWDRIALLDYITSDKHYHNQLSGLQLLPLNDGSWSAYSKLSEPIYICTSNEAVALWGLESKILLLHLPSVLLERLRKVTDLGTTQLVKFNAAENGLALLMESVNQVQQRKRPSGKQLQTWLEQVWSLLQQLELNTVTHLPLLPSCPSPNSPTALLSLSSPIIVQNNTQSLLPKSAVQALKLLGIEVVPQPPHYVRHHQLHSYLYNTSDGRGVNSALSKMISYSNLHNSDAYFNAKSSEVQQKALVNAIDLNSLQPDVNTFLAKLNIIQSVGKCRKPKNDCVERVNKIIPDLDDFPVNFPEALLKPQSIRHQKLAIILGAKPLSKEELCLLSLSNKVTYSEEEISKLALYILSDKNMMTNDKICHKLQGLRFVPDVNNDLHLPGELYNPEDGDIDALIAEDLTPICHYHQYLPALVKLGLKKVVELPKHLLIQAIKHVQSNSITTEENNRKSRALLRVLEQRQDLEDVCKAVKDEAFIYGVTAKPRDYPKHLRWATKPDLLTPASLKSYSKYKDVLGSVMQLVQCSHLPKVAKGFDWNKDPDTSYICDNFRNMITAYQSCKDGCFEMSKKIYKHLSEIAKSSEAHNLKCLSELPCVFTGYDGFKLPHQVYLKQHAMEDVDLRPYIYPLPYELRDWTDLFEYLGCFVNQSVDLYLKFLIYIQEDHNTNTENNNVDRDRKLVVSVLEKLAKIVEIPPSQLLFPVENDDDSLELVKKELCSYSDQNCEWLSSDELGVRIVHKCVPLKVAHSLGVKQLSEHLVSGGEAMMECSQKEPLTTRLHNLVGQYRDGVTIIKELIQNADDAGATTVSFLYDERQNEDAKTRLLSPQLKQWQGPALWAFNDATFTEEDFQNLQLLGGGTKEAQSTKIGKFGLGFCSIYNLTDVPSLMSGSSYVIFDPHLECLGHDKKLPGLRYNFGTKSNSRMLTKLLGQFKPFDKMFDCTIQDTKKYDGTLFRFPLRTPSQATKSKICQISYDRTGMMQLFDMLWNIAGQLLLFTQNVKEIKVFSLACDASSPSEMKLLFKSNSVPFNEPVMNKVQETPLKKAHSLFKEHSEFQWNGNVYQETTMVNINVKSYPEWKEEKCQIKVGSESVTWLTSWHSGRPKDRVYHLAETLAGKALPLGAVSTPVCQDSSGWKPVCLKDLPTGFYRESRMHCFLPLPVKTTLPLPVQVNGYFEIAADRTSLLSQTSDDRQNLNWNTLLIEGSISSAYHSLLDEMINILGQSTEVPYYNLWPLAADRNNDLVTTLITSFYQLLVKEKWRVFYSNNGWYPLNHCLFLEDNFYQQQIGKVAFEYMEIVLASSKKQQHLIELPEKIQAGFQYDCLSEYCISQNSFYTSYFIPTISDDNVTPKKRDALTLHMIDHVNTCVESLKDVACIPTRPNGKLRIPTDLVSPESQVAKMYTESNERFPQYDFTNTSHRCQVLLDLGVKKNTIPIEWVEERACSVAEIRCLKCALYRFTEILNYMTNQDEDVENAIASKLQTLSFLPVMGKPSDWQCAWKADEYVDKQSALCSSHAKGKKTLGNMNAVTFAKPLDLYSSNFQELVGSTKLIVRPIQGKKHYKMQESVMILLGVTVDHLHLPLESVLDQLVVFSTAPHLDKIDVRCHAIYDHLEKVLKLQPSSFSEFGSLKNKNILLTKKHGFVEPGQFALSSECDCAPDLFSASMEGLDKYKLLMDALGITPIFSYNVVLKTILSKKDVCGKKKMSDLKVSQMSKLLSELFRVRSTNQVSDLSLHLPDTKGYLHPVNKLCFDDGSILSSGKLLCLHNNISVSKDMLTWLGILSKTQKRLEGSSRRMCFGQKEPLTTRLRNILQDYPCDVGIMKELLQNADDAGATEVKFIIDLRHLPTDKLFDKKYAPLQGPSLLVYNNKGFTANDLESIQNLGDSTKKEDPASTGQYGIGFNAVYHLTDAPSFLTKGPDVPEGSTICMFDPHCRYDPLATAESPGVRFTQLDELRKDHPHSFMGYLEEQCLHKEGTVFRLPLRSSPNSDISKTVMTGDDLIKLVMEIQTIMTGCMLFLRNVRKVTVEKIDETGKKHQEYSVKSRILKESDVTNNIFRKTQSTIPYKNLFAHEMLRYSYKMKITDDTKKTSVWLIVQQCGAQNKESIPDSMKEAIEFGYLRLRPHAGVALLLNSNIEAKKNLYTTSCYLPLPTDSGLPFSINGHFALASSRQGLWTGTQGWKVTWNQWLMKEVLLPAAVFAIDEYRLSIFCQDVNYLDELDCQSKINSFQKHLPNMNDMKSANWQWFTQKFYEHIRDNEVPFFDIFIPDRDHVQVRAKEPRREGKLLWHALKETGSEFPVYFSDPRLRNSNVLDTLKRLGMKISSDVMCSKLKSADPEYPYPKLTPASVLNFLTSWSKCFPDNCKPNLEKKVEETPFLKTENVLDLFQYISKELNDSSNVQNLPLLLTNDSVLRSFSNSQPVFNSFYCHLLPKLGKEFVNERLVSEIKKHVHHFEQANVVKPFTIMDLCNRLPLVLDSSYHSQDAMVKLTKSGSNFPNKWWLQEVWKFVTEKCKYKFTPKSEPSSHTFPHQLRPFSDEVDWTASRKHILQTLGDWALYPVTYAGCIYLVPLNNAWRSLDVDSFEYNSPFRLLPIPQPYKFKDINIIPAQLNLAATQNEPQGVLKVLHFHENEIYDFITKDQLDVSGILEYLGRHCKEKMLCIRMISQLRIFINAAGQPCSLLNRKIIVPESVTLASMNQIALDNGYVIMMKPKSTDTWHLYEYIQSGYLSTDLDIYSQFILLHLKHLEEHERMSYLKTLTTLLSLLRNRPDVISVLKNTEFIELDGRLVTANKFYDPSNPVFRVMKAANLPQIWSDRSWRELLIMAGMIHTVTPYKYLEYARSLKASDPDVEAKSKELVKHLNQTNCDVDMMRFVGEIRDIEFLLPYKIQTDLQKILPCFKTASGLVSFSQGVHSQFKFLVWSTASILQEYATKYNLLTYMNISNTPPAEKAQQHITKFCQACSGANNEVNETVMEKIYEYLETQSAICNTLKQEEVPVVHIQKHSVFVCASQVIVNLEEEILPYLYKAPIKYGKYYNVFQMMGMEEKASCDTYALVLARIYQSNMNHKLHPGEMNSMTMALKGMLKYEQHLHKLSVEVLYLPTKEGTLSKSSEMLVADNHEYLMTIQSQLKDPLFLGFVALRIEKDNGDFVKHLPERLRPKFVSQMVLESLVFDGVEETFSSNVVQLKESLGGPAFKTGVLRVINHFKVNESVGMTEKEKQAIITKLSQVVVTELKEIKVSLKYCDKVIGSKLKCYHLVQEDNKMTLYLSQQISSVLQTALSIMYSNLLNVKNTDVLISLSIIFICIMKPHDIHKRLDEHNIMEYRTQSFPCHFYSTDLGSYLDEKFIHLLDNSFGDFHAGEIVCMKKYDLEDLEDGDEGREDMGEEDNTFVIVKVLLLVEKSSVCKMMNIYEVSKGDEEPTFNVKAHRLYRFVREVSDSVIPFTHQQGKTEQERKYEMTEEELRKKIRKQVVEIWRVENERDRRSLLRRLMFEWHPDKNPLRKELCTRLFQYIQSLVGRLERGETIPEDDLDSDSSPGPSRAYNYNYSRSRFSSTFGGFSSTFGESYSTFGEPYFGRFTRQPRDRTRMGDRPESRKWWRHADHDLEEAERDLGRPACYTIYFCMQAAEKLLKACIYQVNRAAAAKLKIHSLTRLCQELNLPNVLELTQELEAKVGNNNWMRYPNFHGCPCDHYGEEDALFVLEKVRNLKQLLMPNFNF